MSVYVYVCGIYYTLLHDTQQDRRQTDRQTDRQAGWVAGRVCLIIVALFVY